jgi:hypothetical protein
MFVPTPQQSADARDVDPPADPQPAGPLSPVPADEVMVVRVDLPPRMAADSGAAQMWLGDATPFGRPLVDRVNAAVLPRLAAVEAEQAYRRSMPVGTPTVIEPALSPWVAERLQQRGGDGRRGPAGYLPA